LLPIDVLALSSSCPLTCLIAATAPGLLVSTTLKRDGSLESETLMRVAQFEVLLSGMVCGVLPICLLVAISAFFMMVPSAYGVLVWDIMNEF